MKERPILFSAPMVRAILEGRKTQTRRAMRAQYSHAGLPQRANPADLYCGTAWHFRRDDGKCEWHVDCPYGSPGDRLWVRESIKLVARRDDENGPDTDIAVYAADEQVTLLDTWTWQREVLPGIHMPYGLRRITLEVAGVRVERLHAITEEDARAEGVEPSPFERKVYPSRHAASVTEWDHRAAFHMLWESINGAESWRSNPWVWVVEFKRLESAAKSEMPW